MHVRIFVQGLVGNRSTFHNELRSTKLFEIQSKGAAPGYRIAEIDLLAQQASQQSRAQEPLGWEPFAFREANADRYHTKCSSLLGPKLDRS